jgi:hypothetical protein
VRLRTDDRGVTVQIGTVLLFAVLIILMSTYQATVVPQQNEQVEFNHNQQVQGQLQDLRDELRRTAVTGSGGSTSVALGTRYPVRAVFVNPAPPSGTLRTTPPANVTLRNATAIGETGDYWDGSARNFSTRGLTYDPIYHVYQKPPTTVYDNGVLYNRFDGANRTLAGQRLVRGNRISLVALNGSFSESASGSATVDFEAVSPATRTVTVRNETSNLSVIVPTTRPASEWEELLAEELNRSKGDDRYVLAVENGPRKNTVRVVLEPGTYELELAKVGVGSDVTGVEPHYVTDVRGDNSSVAENSTQTLVVEVRDRYNNPVSGITVYANASLENASVTPTTATTDDDGRASLTYTAPKDVNGVAATSDTINVSYEVNPATTSQFDPTARQNLSLNLSVRNADRSGIGDGANINPSRDGAVVVQNEQIVDKSDGVVSFEFNNTGRLRNVTSARVNFYYTGQTPKPSTADILGPDGNPRTTDPLTVGGRFEPLNVNGGPIELPNESPKQVKLDFDDAVKEGDFFVITVIFDSGESSATYFIAAKK